MMIKKSIHLAVAEENPAEMPEEMRQLGAQTWQTMWQVCHNLAEQEIERIRQHYQQQEAILVQQRQEAEAKSSQAHSDILVAQQKIEALTRETQSLEVDLNQKAAELQSTQDQIIELKEKNVQAEHEIKRLTEEGGRLRENVDNLKKRVQEATHQAEQDRAAFKETSEAIAVSTSTCGHLEKNLQGAVEQTEQLQKQLRQEQNRVVAAETTTREVKELTKKLEGEIFALKGEKQNLKGVIETEVNARNELEKKIGMLTARLESQEWGYKELVTRLERELEIIKEESSTLRSRVIRAEGALEREKKAVERLESKLVATGNRGTQ